MFSMVPSILIALALSFPIITFYIHVHQHLSPIVSNPLRHLCLPQVSRRLVLSLKELFSVGLQYFYLLVDAFYFWWFCVTKRARKHVIFCFATSFRHRILWLYIWIAFERGFVSFMFGVVPIYLWRMKRKKKENAHSQFGMTHWINSSRASKMSLFLFLHPLRCISKTFFFRLP